MTVDIPGCRIWYSWLYTIRSRACRSYKYYKRERMWCYINRNEWKAEASQYCWIGEKGTRLAGFRVVSKPDETKKETNFKNKSTDGSEFRKKQKPDNDLKMLESRVDASYDPSLIMKVNKSFIFNALKWSYLLSNSATWRTAFNVEISTVQSCTCSSFGKNGHRVLCKHILFIVLHVLNNKDLEPSLWMRFIEENHFRSRERYQTSVLTRTINLLNTLVLFYHKFGKCKKSASGLQNVQTVAAERLLILEPSVLSSRCSNGIFQYHRGRHSKVLLLLRGSLHSEPATVDKYSAFVGVDVWQWRHWWWKERDFQLTQHFRHFNLVLKFSLILSSLNCE